MSVVFGRLEVARTPSGDRPSLLVEPLLVNFSIVG
jgi:hypothetical protein